MSSNSFEMRIARALSTGDKERLKRLVYGPEMRKRADHVEASNSDLETLYGLLFARMRKRSPYPTKAEQSYSS